MHSSIYGNIRGLGSRNLPYLYRESPLYIRKSTVIFKIWDGGDHVSNNSFVNIRKATRLLQQFLDQKNADTRAVYNFIFHEQLASKTALFCDFSLGTCCITKLYQSPQGRFSKLYAELLLGRGLLIQQRTIAIFTSIKSLDCRRRCKYYLAASRLSINLFSYLEQKSCYRTSIWKNFISLL